jgi:hypothetical protein
MAPDRSKLFFLSPHAVIASGVTVDISHLVGGITVSAERNIYIKFYENVFYPSNVK